MNVRLLRIAGVLAAALSLHAKDNERNMRWEELSNSLSGQDVTVVQNDHQKSSGTLVQIGVDELTLRTRQANHNISRTKIERIVTRPVFHRSRGRVIGTLVGAGVGIVVLAVALTYTNNEHGSNSDAIVGTAVGITAGTTVLGYFAGREADKERTVIHVIPAP
ncbi:MAG TPA: hypothetical protein VH351_19550 [Bryobacteraceae bacterium]|jgi:hypothetical protein|nr:hypothetical protein [Bryobacteraceae bacterium]